MMKLGNCYEIAASALLATFGLGKNATVESYRESGDRLLLVHGHPVGCGGNAEGLKYSHAWLEVEFGGVPSLVIDLGSFKGDAARVVPLGAYYEAGSIDPDEVWRYDSNESRKMILENEHWGPWHKEPDGVEA